MCYFITQNALADPTYLDYIRAQYNRSLQLDPPFFQEFLPTELPQVFHGPTRSLAWLDDIFENLGAKIERQRRTGTSWFKEDHFKDAAKLAAQLRPHEPQDELSKYLYGKLSKETQALLGGQTDSRTLRRALAADFNRILTNTAEGPTIYAPERFKAHQAAAADPEGGADHQPDDQYDGAAEPADAGGGLPRRHCEEPGRSLSGHRNPHGDLR